MTQRGRFITIEGVEGVGKSTSIEFIEETLRRHGIPAVATREPGGTPLGEKIRALLLDRGNTSMDEMTELLLMFAARVQHVRQLIEPALARGNWVISDRFTDSSYAYQGGGRGVDSGLIEQVEEISLGQFRPDLTIILDLPVEAGMARATNRGERDRFEAEDLAFFERVRATFMRLAADNDRYHIVDASGDIDAVQAALAPIVEAEISRAKGS
ncbi:MAG TPA: dTMP kinase [Pseudomonadales bacterium]|nr:dTMP kinase [Pseudomonadales bacterium]